MQVWRTLLTMNSLLLMKDMDPIFFILLRIKLYALSEFLLETFSAWNRLRRCGGKQNQNVLWSVTVKCLKVAQTLCLLRSCQKPLQTRKCGLKSVTLKVDLGQFLDQAPWKAISALMQTLPGITIQKTWRWCFRFCMVWFRLSMAMKKTTTSVYGPLTRFSSCSACICIRSLLSMLICMICTRPSIAFSSVEWIL